MRGLRILREEEEGQREHFCLFHPSFLLLSSVMLLGFQAARCPPCDDSAVYERVGVAANKETKKLLIGGDSVNWRRDFIQVWDRVS